MTKDEAIAAAEALAKPTWDKPVKLGWHSSSADYGHITVDDNDIVDVQFYGVIETRPGVEPSQEDLGYFVQSVRETVALVEEVNKHRDVMRELRRAHDAAQGQGDQGAWNVWGAVTHILGIQYDD